MDSILRHPKSDNHLVPVKRGFLGKLFKSKTHATNAEVKAYHKQYELVKANYSGEVPADSDIIFVMLDNKKKITAYRSRRQLLVLRYLPYATRAEYQYYMEAFRAVTSCGQLKDCIKPKMARTKGFSFNNALTKKVTS